jgi:hypothetical protein
MRDLLQHWVERLAKPRTIALLWILQLVPQFYQLLVSYPRLARLHPGTPLDMRLLASAEGIRDYLSGLGDIGRHYYLINEAGADMLFPLGYGTTYSLLLYRLLKQVAPAWIALACLPAVAALADIGENLSIIVALQQFPSQAALPAYWFFNSVKHATAVLAVLTLATSAVAYWRNRATGSIHALGSR